MNYIHDNHYQMFSTPTKFRVSCCYYRDVYKIKINLKNITDSAACFPDGADWESVPNGDYASCGTRCLEFI